MDLELSQNTKPSYKFLILDNFAIKVIAIVTMTLDHIGRLIFFIQNPLSETPLYTTCIVFMILGRLALPLFAFLCAKSLKYTHSRPIYLLRLGIMASLIGGALIIGQYGFNLHLTGFDNIFITLFLGALVIFLLEQRRIYLKLLGVLPIAYVIILNYLRMTFNLGFYPVGLLPQYETYGLLLILGAYFGQKLLALISNIHDYRIGNPKETTFPIIDNQIYQNLVQVFVLIMINLFAFAIANYIGDFGNTFFLGFNIEVPGVSLSNMQLFTLFASLPIFFYGEKVGYNKRWFRYFTYAYYPLHIIIGAIIIVGLNGWVL